MTRARPILLTGVGGRLGTELRGLLPDVIAPSHAECDVTDPEAVRSAVERYRPAVVVHAAAYTDVAGAESRRDLCWRTNVEGTRHVAMAAANAGAALVHMSTDYVFEGTRGGYRENDTPGPPRNYYSLTKLVAEQIARMCPRRLILRTSFRPRQWPYDKAFTDVFTGQDYVDILAPEIALAIRRLEDIPFEILHIATERKSVYDLARRRRPDVRPASKKEAPVELPDDISLDTGRWQELKARWNEST